MARFYVLFNSIPVISRPREVDNERMNEMEPRFHMIKFPAPGEADLGQLDRQAVALTGYLLGLLQEPYGMAL